MNYTKNATVHYECVKKLCQEELVKLCGNELFSASLLLSLSAYKEYCNKPATGAEELAALLAKSDKCIDYADEKAVTSKYLKAKALWSYAKIDGSEAAGKAAIKLFHDLVNAYETDKEEIGKNNRLREVYAGALLSIADFIADDKKAVVGFATDVSRLFLEDDFIFSDAFYAINGAIGLLSVSTREPALLSSAIKAGKKIAELCDNLDYSFNTSFKGDKHVADPVATSFALSFFVDLYKKTGDNYFLFLSRRIWLCGMQFFERRGGFVGYNVPPRGNMCLSVLTYKERFITPLFYAGLCAYESNKGLFENDDNAIVKDSKGRYFVGDKLFGRELGEYFGKDLIELPSLISFDEEDAIRFKFKIKF